MIRMASFCGSVTSAATTSMSSYAVSNFLEFILFDMARRTPPPCRFRSCL